MESQTIRKHISGPSEGGSHKAGAQGRLPRFPGAAVETRGWAFYNESAVFSAGSLQGTVPQMGAVGVFQVCGQHPAYFEGAVSSEADMKGWGGANLFLLTVLMIILTQQRAFTSVIVTVTYFYDDSSLTSCQQILNPESVPAHLPHTSCGVSRT